MYAQGTNGRNQSLCGRQSASIRTPSLSPESRVRYAPREIISAAAEPVRLDLVRLCA